MRMNLDYWNKIILASYQTGAIIMMIFRRFWWWELTNHRPENVENRQMLRELTGG